MQDRVRAMCSHGAVSIGTDELDFGSQPPPINGADADVSRLQDTKRDARSVLSRTGLLAELQAKGILNLVPAEVKAIHGLLEADFNPLELCQKLVRSRRIWHRTWCVPGFHKRCGASCVAVEADRISPKSKLVHLRRRPHMLQASTSFHQSATN